MRQIEEDKGTKDFFSSYPKKSRKRKLDQSAKETPVEKAPVLYKRITRSMKKLNDDQPIFHKDKEPPVTIHLDLEKEEGIPDPSNLNKPRSPSFKDNPSKENDDSSPFEPPMVDTQDGFIPSSEPSE